MQNKDDINDEIEFIYNSYSFDDSTFDAYAFILNHQTKTEKFGDKIIENIGLCKVNQNIVINRVHGINDRK